MGLPHFRLFTIWASAGSAGHSLGCGIGLLGILERNRSASGILKNQALWPLSLYMSNITADNAGVSLIASLITLMPPL